jgi:outer membrane protein assembly factor BamB
MPHADDQPWSPFPVQDWSSLPPDPLGSVAINPTWPEPKDPRPWWQPLLVFGLVAALVAGAAFVASSVGVASRVTAASRFLPADGAASYERTATTRELQTTVGIAVTESARLPGVVGLFSTDGAFATKMLAEADPNRIQTWRTTTTSIDDPTAAPGPRGTPSTIAASCKPMLSTATVSASPEKCATYRKPANWVG